MSSENVSKDMAQRKINLVLVDNKVMVEGSQSLVVNLESPVLNAGELYNAVFADINEPTTVVVTASNEVLGKKEAKLIYDNIKSTVDDAIKEINEGLMALKDAELEEMETVLAEPEDSANPQGASNEG